MRGRYTGILEHANFYHLFLISEFNTYEMRNFCLFAIVLSIACAEVYFQEKFDEGKPVCFIS